MSIEHPTNKSRLSQIYKGMKARCYQKSDKDYRSYGEKGILICDEWKRSYVEFRKWALANGYKDDLTIDRVDPTKGYSPDNCQWIPRFENETKNAVPITAWGESKFVWEWKADNRCQVDDRRLIRTRIYNGWSPEDAISTPYLGKGHRRATRQSPEP